MSSRMRVGVFIALGLLISLLVAGVASYYASSSPDGLEFVAEQEGFLDTARDSAVAGSPLADYGVVGLDQPRLSVGVAGIIGVAATAVIGFGLFSLLGRGRGASARR